MQRVNGVDKVPAAGSTQRYLYPLTLNRDTAILLLMNATNSSTRQQKAAERKAWKVRQAQLRTEGLAVVATKQCPCCGQGIRYNNAITGW